MHVRKFNLRIHARNYTEHAPARIAGRRDECGKDLPVEGGREPELYRILLNHEWTRINTNEDPAFIDSFRMIACQSVLSVTSIGASRFVFIRTTFRESFFSVHEFLPQRTQRPHREAILSLRSLRSLRLATLVATSAALCRSVVEVR